jgi:hypothetical protein
MSLLPATAAESALNRSIVQFCEEHLGQKVGTGSCFALANQALHQAGATRRFRDSPGQGDYVWGELVFYLEATGADPKTSGSLESVVPGDIIQFRDCHFQRKGGFANFGHHTAVIREVNKDGLEWKILQENFGGKRFVTALTLRPRDLKKGWIRVYQPLLPAPSAQPAQQRLKRHRG